MLKYLKVQTENLWKTAEAWSDATKTYNEFKNEVLKLYPGTMSDRTYTVQDLDLAISHYARISIISSADLGKYHRRFLLISQYLISKNRLATQEQSRSFFRGLRPQLEGRVRQWLQQKLIDHFPDNPYVLSDIYEAVHYVLMGTAFALRAPTQGQGLATFSSPTATSSPSPQVADATQVKLETLTSAITSLSKTVKNLLQTQAQQAGSSKPRPTGTTSARINASGNSVCNFCGILGHFIWECEVVEEFTRFGKCKRSPEGKVILPTGAMVPRSIPRAWMHNHVEEWHRQNPGQMATQMYVEVMAAPVVTAPLHAIVGQSYYGHPTPNAIRKFPKL